MRRAPRSARSPRLPQIARDQLAYTVIRAPVDGVVGAKNVEIGATVSPGQSLLQIVPSSGHYVTANFKETQLGNMRVGQTVDIGVDAYKGAKFAGRVDSIGPASQNTLASSRRRTRPATS